MINRTILPAALLLLCGCPALSAQDQIRAAAPPQAQDAAQPPDPQLKPNPAQVLREFEPAPTEEYRLGKGDEITVDFTGRPDMQARVVVGPDGRVSLPLASDILVAGRTRSEAAKAIEAALLEYYATLEVVVAVTRYTSNHVLLLGAVDHPGVYSFEGAPKLLEVIGKGMETGASRIGQMPERCAIYRGQDQVIWVELKALLESGNAAANLSLRRDDVVYVPALAERFVSVLGEVAHPGAVPLTNNTTLASVIASAGGFGPRAGIKPHIQIVDPANGVSRVISMDDLVSPVRTLEVTLRPGEIIFVPQGAFYKATYFLERLNPLTTMATMATLTGVL